MIKANAIAKKSAASSPAEVENYLESRIKSAVDNGFTSTKAWVKKVNLDAALTTLTEAGYSYNVVQEEPLSVQLNITW